MHTRYLKRKQKTVLTKSILSKNKIPLLHRHSDKIWEESMNFINFLTRGFRLCDTSRVGHGSSRKPLPLDDHIYRTVSLKRICSFQWTWADSTVFHITHSMNEVGLWVTNLSGSCCTSKWINSPGNLWSINCLPIPSLIKQRAGVCQQPWVLDYSSLLCVPELWFEDSLNWIY